MDLVLHVTRFQLRAYLRNRRARMFTLIIPLILLALLAGVFHGGETTVSGVTIDYRQFFVPSVIVFSLTLTTLAMLVASVVQQRELGILKRRRATPMPAWALIVSQSLTVVLMAIGTVILLLAVGAIAFGVHFPAKGLPALVLGVLGGAVAFCGLGYALSTFADSADAAQPMIQLIMFPLFFISGIWIPLSELPTWLATIAKIFPVEHVADLVHRAYVGAVPVGPVLLDFAVLLAWAVVGATIAARRFVWLPPRRG
ncbi:MAG TPA: ABC transporter permease [Solirubrobacterales bacterium]|nr:ABC transporter permease [Solirubrobacterales bacterium]